jgi:hypothetical protein
MTDPSTRPGAPRPTWSWGYDQHVQYEYRAVSYDKFGEPRSSVARAERDAEQMQVASTQRESRIQVRAIDPETDKISSWTFLDESSSS